ncbi:MAG: DeoR/GlpR family DNA-binding transcription regulator [Alphaproteobacteria bacterium]
MQRQDRIVERVHQEGYTSVEDLASVFGVTPQTIRRDIGILQDEGRLRRYHGGAATVSTVENMAYTTRQVLCQDEKRAIARHVASLVPDSASLILNIGTTTEEVARALVASRAGLRIITNNLNVAAILQGKRDFEVYAAGGLVRHRDGGIVGESALEFMRQFKVDIAIIGISGIDADDGALLDYDFREVQVSRQIMASARQTWLVADHTKFGRNATVRLCSLADIHALVTDRKPPDNLAALMAAAGRLIHVAPVADRAAERGLARAERR